MSTASPFRSHPLGALLDLWDERLDEELRAQILAELKGRGYRTGALPAPPLGSGVAHIEAYSGAPSSWWIIGARAVLALTGIVGLFFAVVILLGRGAEGVAARWAVIPMMLFPSTTLLAFFAWSFRAPERSLSAAAALCAAVFAVLLVLAWQADNLQSNPLEKLMGVLFLLVLLQGARQALRIAAGAEDE